MSANRERLIMFSLWVSESARVFSFAAIIALLVGLDAAPLTWTAAAAIMGVSMVANWVIGGARGDLVTLALVQALVGFPVIYLAAAARGIGGALGLDLDWPLALTAGDMDPDEVVGVILAIPLAFIVWLRGIALLNSEEPESVQRSIFYTGAAALGILLLMERIIGNDVDARFLILPFFAAALAGMAITHLATVGDVKSGSAFWGRFMTMTVGGVLLFAITITVLAVVFNDAVHALGRGIGVLLSWILIAIAAPFAVVAMGVIWLLSKFRGEGRTDVVIGADSNFELNTDTGLAVVDDGKSSVFDLVVDLLRIPLAIIIVLAILFVLYITFRRYMAKRRIRPGNDRESVRGDADAGKDLVGLLGKLLPEWMRRHGGSEVERRYPADEPGISEVFQLYFRYLKAATRRGMSPGSGHTPNELRGAMSRALPGMPVDLMTDRFNAACYGHEPSSSEIVGRLRAGLQD
ncbi:MAG TPA: DUF4129 domain-containing protein [Dehalococcoidia bacterium]|nr:DUF4129 domain-containing protein [Dehalococcoidia bacterium]